MQADDDAGGSGACGGQPRLSPYPHPCPWASVWHLQESRAPEGGPGRTPVEGDVHQALCPTRASLSVSQARRLSLTGITEGKRTVPSHRPRIPAPSPVPGDFEDQEPFRALPLPARLAAGAFWASDATSE